MARYEVTVPYMQVKSTTVIIEEYYGNFSWYFVAELPDSTNMQTLEQGGFYSEFKALKDALVSLNATVVKASEHSVTAVLSGVISDVSMLAGVNVLDTGEYDAMLSVDRHSLNVIEAMNELQEAGIPATNLGWDEELGVWFIRLKLEFVAGTES